ncbi:MAG TPA: hypothetical protein VFQ41_12085 [Candidatus Angelobacter sp.]|nr:hypothetical protein [Candidatus Angelobacter sp.]
MPRKTLKIIAVGLLMIVTVAGTGAVHNKAKQPLSVAMCCGAPPPICPGSPGCPGTKQ